MKHFLYFHKNLKLIYDQAFTKRKIKKTYHAKSMADWMSESIYQEEKQIIYDH